MNDPNHKGNTNVYDILQERGFLQQVTDGQALKKLLHEEKLTCYVGYDPTADSLHVGNLVTIMPLTHMQQQGHRVIFILGGGTALVGDPSGKTEMRKMLKPEQIQENLLKFKIQVAKYIDFSDNKALILDNYEWLGSLKYIEFLRDIGTHFSVNRMLTAEAYKLRLETGLTFIEFNYQLLQAFDYLTLFRRYNCKLQMGGDDQWGNILAGADLIRRIEGAIVHGLTFPLVTTATGEKMGKTVKGAVWLDGNRLSPYDYFQYWINTDDRDVARFMAYFSYLPMIEINTVQKLAGAELNLAKTVLAYEATKITHGEAEAQKALQAASGVFGSRTIEPDFMPSSTIPRGKSIGEVSGVPTTQFDPEKFRGGYWIIALLTDLGLTSSRGEARRLIQQGGVYANDVRVRADDWQVRESDFVDNLILLRIGKKRYHRVIKGVG